MPLSFLCKLISGVVFERVLTELFRCQIEVVGRYYLRVAYTNVQNENLLILTIVDLLFSSTCIYIHLMRWNDKICLGYIFLSWFLCTSFSICISTYFKKSQCIIYLFICLFVSFSSVAISRPFGSHFCSEIIG